MRAPGCKRGKEMELSYKANKQTIYLFQLLSLGHTQVHHVGNMQNEYKYPKGQAPEFQELQIKNSK